MRISVNSVLRFVDLQGRPTESYPYNPNGSDQADWFSSATVVDDDASS